MATELERVLEEARKTGVLKVTFEGVKNEEVKLSMEIQGNREDQEWVLYVRLGDGTCWSKKCPESELLTIVQGFLVVFAKMGRERPRA